MRKKLWIPALVLGVLLVGVVIVRLNPSWIAGLTEQKGKQYSQEVRLEEVIVPDEAVVPLSEVRETLLEAYEQHYTNITLPEYTKIEIPDELGVYKSFYNTIPFEQWEEILATMFEEGTFAPEDRTEIEFVGDLVYYDFNSPDNICRASIMNNGEVTMTYDEDGFININHIQFWFYDTMSEEEKALYSGDVETAYDYLGQNWEKYGLETGYTVTGISEAVLDDGTAVATIYITQERDGLLYCNQEIWSEDYSFMYYGMRVICLRVYHDTHELMGVHMQLGKEEQVQTVSSILPLTAVLKLVEQEFAAEVYLNVREISLMYAIAKVDGETVLCPVWCLYLTGNKVMGDGQYVYIDALNGTVTATFVNDSTLY